jgi:hypothetical protein
MLPIRTTSKCLLCFNMGAEVRAFGWVDIVLPNGRVKEVGLCFKHLKPRTEKYPNGMIDPEHGEWKKTPFGKMPIRDEKYRLCNDDSALITGVAGKVPKWW